MEDLTPLMECAKGHSRTLAQRSNLSLEVSLPTLL